MPAPPGRIIGRGAWHLEEDEALKAAVKIHGSKSWATVSTVRQTHTAQTWREIQGCARSTRPAPPPPSGRPPRRRNLPAAHGWAFSPRLAARFPRAAAAPRAPPVFREASTDPVPLRAAQLVPGRTGKQCRERWTSKVRPRPNRFAKRRASHAGSPGRFCLAQLDMNVKREPWSKAEDARLIASQAKSAPPAHLSSPC